MFRAVQARAKRRMLLSSLRGLPITRNQMVGNTTKRPRTGSHMCSALSARGGSSFRCRRPFAGCGGSSLGYKQAGGRVRLFIKRTTSHPRANIRPAEEPLPALDTGAPDMSFFHSDRRHDMNRKWSCRSCRSSGMAIRTQDWLHGQILVAEARTRTKSFGGLIRWSPIRHHGGNDINNILNAFQPSLTACNFF